jgi:hypothetical protein
MEQDKFHGTVLFRTILIHSIHRAHRGTRSESAGNPEELPWPPAEPAPPVLADYDNSMKRSRTDFQLIAGRHATHSRTLTLM